MSLNPLSRNYLQDISCKPQPKKQKASSSNKQRVKKSQQPKEEKTEEQANQNITTSGFNIIQRSFPIEGYKASYNLVYTYEGFMFAFLRNDRKISGRACVLFPEGIIVNCNILNGFLSGWAAICKKDVFYCLAHYTRGKFDGAQFTLDVGCGLMMKSVYKGGKLQSIKQGAAQGTSSFQKLVQSKQLINLLDQTVDNAFFQKNFSKLQSPIGTYYGQLSYEIPSGVGVLLTENEMFYGQFYRGLLDGQGTMSFQNGDSYVGEVKEGMMRGTGHYMKRGVSTYRYYEAELTPEEFKQLRKNASWKEIPQIESIFHPLVSFYIKLQEIYQHRTGNTSSRKDSYVEIALDNQNEEQHVQQLNESEDMDRQSQKSSKALKSSGNYKIDILNDLIRTNTGRIGNNSDKQRQKQKQKEALRLSAKNKLPQAEEIQEIAESELGQQLKTKKNGASALKDYEWEEIIEELEEESVTKQDGFLKPKEENKQGDNDSSLKKNPLNSRINPRSAISSDFNSQEEKDRLQNRILTTLSKKK